jgi:cytoskeletal protein RodZ
MCPVMATREQGAGLPIGDVLKRTRTRRKVDLATVEQQTKIRAKYLRALENEEWDLLPGPAYAKGFLRTYAQFLGLDGDALVDEYRRTVEAALDAEHAYGFEPVLERRRRPGGEPRRGWSARAWVIGILGAGAVVLIVILSLTSGNNDDRSRHHKGHKEAHHHGNRGNPSGGKSSSQPVTLKLVTRADMEICLVTGQGEALIDAQTLGPGAEEGPFPKADNYRLDLDSGGAVKLTLDGKAHKVSSATPASYMIDSNGIKKTTSFKGPGCP